MRQLVVEDDFKVIHVQAARRHVGRDQQVDLVLAEALHHALAHHLRHVAMQLVSGVATGDQRIRQLIDLNLGEAKDDTILHIMQVQQAAQHLSLRTVITST